MNVVYVPSRVLQIDRERVWDEEYYPVGTVSLFSNFSLLLGSSTFVDRREGGEWDADFVKRKGIYGSVYQQLRDVVECATQSEELSTDPKTADQASIVSQKHEATDTIR